MTLIEISKKLSIFFCFKFIAFSHANETKKIMIKLDPKKGTKPRPSFQLKKWPHACRVTIGLCSKTAYLKVECLTKTTCGVSPILRSTHHENIYDITFLFLLVLSMP
jgi:hypothetical protein